MKTPVHKYSYKKYFILNVVYDGTPANYPKLDKTISKILGLKPTGAGMLLTTMQRDLNFRYEEEDKIETAHKLMKKSGFKSSIHIYETDTP